MAWDAEVPKLGDSISIFPSANPADDLRKIAEVIELQAEGYLTRARTSRSEADQSEQTAATLKRHAGVYRAAIAKLGDEV